jgi:sulfatase maturation enzyme AslB (radical SAM superfamily)|tara:strand:+ start:362 stop:865 length:504 start_codon:yes stop_codon:yes gene_type:complete
MDQVPERDNIKYSILTNGLMFKEFYTRIPYIIKNLNELGVSIDGASKDTYEKLRLGGKWEKILQGLECMAEQKQKYGFRFVLYFVVQKDNYHEMEDIMMLGKSYNADRVLLSRIQDWNTFSNFGEHNIFDSTHPQNPQLQQHLEKLKQFYKSKDGTMANWGNLKYLF